MKLNLSRVITALCLLVWATFANAFSCSLASSGIATAYAPTGVTPNTTTQGSFTLSCSKVLLDPNSMDYTVSVNNGANASATQNRARLGATTSYLQYETFRNSNCSSSWGSAAGSLFTGTLNFNGASTANLTVNYWGCITTAGQIATAGTHTDTVTMTANYPGFLGLLSGSATSTFNVSIINPATCTFTSIENVAFGTYIAFRNTPLTAPNSNIVINCTQNLPYSLSLDTATGVVVGLNYSLTLNVTSNRGTGLNQTHTLSGTMPANQAGTCSSGTCTGSDPRTLIITY
jgi:spore coat protein U-like protein